MRKSFTRLFSIFVLLLGLSLQMAYGIVFDPTKSVPISPNANAKPSDFATKFVVAFDVVPVINASGDGTVVLYKNGGLFRAFPITSANVAVVGKTLEITHGIPVADFKQGDVYSVAISDGAITGLASGALANGVYVFTIGDYVAPTLSTTAADFEPDKGATNVVANLAGTPPSFNLVIPFSEPVNIPATPGDKAVYVYKEDGTIVDIIKVSTIGGLPAANVAVTVADAAIFAENTNYYVVIDAGAFVDASPNKNVFAGLASKTTWTFSTRDNSAPVISAKSVTSITATAATLNVTLAEVGKYYFAVYPALTTPSVTDVVNGTGAVFSGTKTVAAAEVGANVTSALGSIATPLTGGTDYKVWVVTENSVGVKSTSATSVSFKTVDNTAPSALTRGTLRDSAKKTYALYMVFNEQVAGAGSGTLDLRKNSDESYVKQIAAGAITSRKITSTEVTNSTFGAGRSTNDWVVVVDLGMTLPSNVGYYVVFPAGYIKDLAGNAFAGAGAFIVPINKTDWTFTSSDFEVPTVTAAFATPGSLTSNITLTFNETVQKQLSTTTDWAEVVALEQNNTPVAFSITPAAAANTTVLTIDPASTLASNTTYTVRLRRNAVKDISDNANAITTEQVYSLTTGNLDALSVSYGSSVGATAITNLVAASTIKIDFNKGIKVNTTGTTWVAADATNLLPLVTFKKGATAKPFTLAYDATTFTLTLTPTDALVSNASDYVLTFDESKIKDVADVTVPLGAGINTVTYTVKDYLAPVVTASHSGNVENLVANANPKITLADDNLATLTGNGTLLTSLSAAQIEDMVTFKEGSSSGANLGFTAAYAGGVITITPTVALATGKTYYYGIGASVKDANGNAAPATFATFTMVAPVVAPTITATTYTVNGSAQTPIATKLVNITPKTGNVVTLTVTFNDNVKEVQSVAPYAQVTLNDGVNPAWTADVTPTNVSGNTLTVDFTGVAALAALADAGKECTITLPAGLVRGSTAYAPSSFAAFAGATIKVDSKDVTAPTVSANTPADAATLVALNTALKFGFSEKVVLGAGDILIKDGATTVQTIPVNSTNVTLDAAGTLATVVKADLVKYNTTYTVVVPAGAFKDDISLNSNTAATFTFTTLLNPQPTVATYTPADNSDLVSTGGTLTLTMAFSEEVVKYDPLVGTRKLWYLVKEGNLGIRASFNATDDLVMNGGNDVVVANNYIETSSVGISGSTVTIATGYTPVAGERYYVLITNGSFLDKSTGASSGGNVVPGVYTGVTAATTWNFTTKDENPGTVTFTYTKRADNKVAKTSDIVINFTRPIKNGDGSAITDSQIATLFTLTKTAGTGTLGTKAFVGTISADKKTVTILNSSLVTLGEMTELASYTIALTGAAIYENGSAISGASDAFTTSDYTAPAVVPSILASSVTDIYYNATDGHAAKVKFTCTDNSDLAAVYYTIQEGDASTVAPSAGVVKADKTAVVTGTAPAAVNYTFKGLKEETSYVVWAVAVDKAGNESTVEKLVFVTDDITKPVIATLPTSFDAAGKLTFVFNEAVTGVAGSVRILDAATMTELAVLGLNNVAGAGNEKKLITDAFAGLATGNTLVNYYVEIDKGLVNDVPVVAGDVTNTFDGLFRTALMVTSKDVTAPTLVSTTPSLPAIDVNTSFSIKLTFSEAVQKVSVIPADAFVVEKVLPGPAYTVYEIVDPANVVTNGTNDVTINVARPLSSLTEYRLTVKLNAFEDLAGNDHATVSLSGNITAKDAAAPAVVFAPAKGATNVAVGTTTLTMTFAEAIRNLDNSAIDSYDLDSLVYVKKNGVATSFAAALTGGNLITVTIPATAVDQTYTYGFKAKFEDGANNVIAADAATFSTPSTAPTGTYLTWTPARVSASPWTWLGATSAVTLNFTGPIFTYDAVVAANSNLPITPAYLASVITVTKNAVAIPAADLVFTVIDSRTVSVAPKAGTDWGSGSSIIVTLADDKIQINEGNVTPVKSLNSFTSSRYAAEDTVDPVVDAAKDDAVFADGYHPANVGVNGGTPTIAKSDKLKLYFTEDVKAGTGTVEIYRWDGVLAKPAMNVTVDGTDKKLVYLGDLNDLPTNQEYYAIVNPGAVLDVTDSNPYAGLTAVKTWKFKLMDDAIPQIISYMPNNSGNLVTTDLTLSFDRPVVLSGAGYVALYKSAAGGDAVQLYRGADSPAKFSISGSTATIDISLLEQNTTYYVELAEGTFASAADNTKLQPAISRSVWTFSTENNTAPVAVTYSPDKTDPMVVDVPLNSGLSITFDQDVMAGVGNIQLHRKQTFGGPIITNFDVTDATKVKVEGKTLTIAGDVLNLQNNSEYYVIVPGTAVKNTTQTPEYWGGVTVPLTWQFKTFNDVTGPTAVYAPKTTGLLPADVKLTMTFNEAVVLGAGNVTIYDSTDDSVVETFVVAPSMLVGKVLTLVPTVELKQQTTYYVKADAGLVKDVWGNAYLGVNDKTTWKFTTGDFTGPQVVVTPPATPVATVFKVGLKFNEPVTGVANGVIVSGGTLTDVEGTVDTYTLTISAVEQKEVTIELTDAIKDISPNTNKFAGQTLKYTTGDFTAPSLVSWTPLDETTTNNHPTFKMTFNEDVAVGTGGALKVYKVATTTPVLTIPVTAAMINGKEVTVSYAATQQGLDKDARYYVLVEGTALKDKAGNAFIGVSDNTAWTFKTGPVFATGIDPIVNGSLEFKVYPNPFVDYVNVKNASELSKIVVTNIAGQTVKEVVNPTERIQLNELRSGYYFMTLYNADDVVVTTVKIVKR